MPNPNDTFASDWQGAPPGMPVGDYEVWRLFRPFAAQRWTAIAYDVEIRDGPTPIVGDTPEMRRMWARNTARRIDALGWRANVASVIEVRTRAAWQTFGQIQGYAAMWANNYPMIPIDGYWIVTDELPNDIRNIATAAGFYCWVNGELFTPDRPKITWPAGATFDGPHQ